MEENSKIKILFICLGNICRSPAANGIMQHIVNNAGLSSCFYIDSAGIGGWHIGQLPDKRMRSHGSLRGYNFNHLARKFTPRKDFSIFDYIMVMDQENYEDISSYALSKEEKSKIHFLGDYLQNHPGIHIIPDPYYGGDKDFENVLNLLEDSCSGLLKNLTNR